MSHLWNHKLICSKKRCLMGKISFSYLLLSHHPFSEINRTIRIMILNKRIHLCARCTGKYLGLLLCLLLIFWRGHISIPYLIFIFLPLPATLDWLTQTIKIRESKNTLRIITGFIYGLWLGLCIHTVILWDISYLLIIVLQCLGYISVVGFILTRKKGCINEYLKPYEEFVDQYLAQNYPPNV